MHYEVFKSRVPYYDSPINIDHVAECMREIHGPPGLGSEDRSEFVRCFQKIAWSWSVDFWSMLEILFSNNNLSLNILLKNGKGLLCGIIYA